MSLRKPPEAPRLARPDAYSGDSPAEALSRWVERPAASDGEAGSIDILDEIGANPWTGGGVTAAGISAALARAGGQPVTVRINSPGGDMFEGIAIYNLLGQYRGRVDVEILGLAASSASIIAMAGDTIAIGTGAFLMIHNCWGVVVGNHADFADAATLFAGFDKALADIYVARTGGDADAIRAMMGAETFLDAEAALAAGFADRIREGVDAAPPKAAAAIDPALLARRRIEAALARDQVPRAERSELLQRLAGPPAGGPPAARDAGRPSAERDAGIDPAAIKRLIETLRNQD